MNTWIIATIIALLLIVGITAVYAGVSAQQSKTTETISCSGCGNSCTAEKNCGLQTCGAVNGGKCGCNKAG